MKTTHTPEPWLSHEEKIIGDTLLIATCHHGHKNNAARIVACVNACAGLSNQDVAILPNLINEGTGALQERDALQEKLTDLINLVAQVRSLQAEYFRTRDRNILSQSKAAERKLDNTVERYILNQ